MVPLDNLPSKLCAILLQGNSEGHIEDWKLLGQEQNGILIFSWVHIVPNNPQCTHIGLYNYIINKLDIIYSFKEVVNTIQATVNQSKTYLGLVIKRPNEAEDETKQCVAYKIYIIDLENKTSCDLQLENSKQSMIAFLYRKQSILLDKPPDKFLVLIHQETVLQYEMKPNFNNDINNLIVETLVKIFMWAQWDSVHQTLYYIHYRKPIKCLVENDESEKPETKVLSPTLSGLQFHDELPHETVLNIPLNLPLLHPIETTHCGTYEDDVIPLRVHDCSLDLQVLSDSKGFVCICHHYLYQPREPAASFDANGDSKVHFAYSVTLLHQSCVIQSVIPDISWSVAKSIRPTFKLYGDSHLMVFIPGLCTHLLDIGVNHEPCCHITTSAVMPYFEPSQTNLIPVLELGLNCTINLHTLDVIPLTVAISQLVETFHSNTSLDNKIAILHYFLVHVGELDIANELISTFGENPLKLGFSQILKEFLIGSSFVSCQKNLPSDAAQLINLLPVTTLTPTQKSEVQLNGHTICLSQDILWNTAMMLLSPQQRIVPYRDDMWTRLWDQLVKIGNAKFKFKPSQVTEKLFVSLVCYQPEALSRSSTPLSPGGVLNASNALSEFSISANQCSWKSQIDALPFYEIESCTASKQEHIISVNLRELSMHLLKQSTENSTIRFDWQSQSPMHVHAVATRYVTAQLEQSRLLCQILCKAAGVDSRYESEKGFILIDQLSSKSRHTLFTLLERYYLSVESIAFPLPQGFTSFFTFLGYKTLNFEMFLQYTTRNVFELQVDVMKVIMADTDDTKEGITKKLKLLSILPRSRAKRLLNQWNHPMSLMLRAREHALNILSGEESPLPKTHGAQSTRTSQLGLAAFPSADRLSPLDTFLDLLLAKASLPNLDFGLLVEATITSTEEFLDLN